ncbi:acyltransferase [Salinimicrobium flavum]|uniref:Acyltransferase n=1 Tax=Salinimicrobium flavum TaxID=1737065 RepID=A0ABW5ISD6_9FLAO
MINKLLRFYRKTFWSQERYGRYLGVAIGENCSISTNKFGSEPYLIKIGNNVQITNDVVFSTHGACWVFRDKYPTMDVFGKIQIKNNVYIGNGAMILPGVIIGSNVVIGAGSVVTKSIKDFSIVAGNPAKVIGDIRDLEYKMKNLDLKSKGMTYNEKRDFLSTLEEDKFIRK